MEPQKLRPMTRVIQNWLDYSEDPVTTEDDAEEEFIQRHTPGAVILPDGRTGKFDQLLKDTLPLRTRRSNRAKASMPRGEMEEPLDSIQEEPEGDETDVNAPEPMEVDQEEPEDQHLAYEWYPFLDPDSAKTLYATASKIAENCRKVEQSRLLYMKDTKSSWNYYHIPLVRQVIYDNARLRKALRDKNIITNEESGIG